MIKKNIFTPLEIKLKKMKKLIYVFSLLTLIGVVSCQKEQPLQKTEKNEVNQVSPILKSGTQDSIQIITQNLQNLNDYLFKCDSLSNNTFFNYWSSKPNSTLTDLENAGYINKASILTIFSNIEAAAMNIDDGQVIWDLVTHNMDSRFYDDGVPVASQLVIFRCNGCLDRIRRNHCFESLIWTWGPGC